jgi:hypothetical protein
MHLCFFFSRYASTPTAIACSASTSGPVTRHCVPPVYRRIADVGDAPGGVLDRVEDVLHVDPSLREPLTKVDGEPVPGTSNGILNPPQRLGLGVRAGHVSM